MALLGDGGADAARRHPAAGAPWAWLRCVIDAAVVTGAARYALLHAGRNTSTLLLAVDLPDRDVTYKKEEDLRAA